MEVSIVTDYAVMRHMEMSKKQPSNNKPKGVFEPF